MALGYRKTTFIDNVAAADMAIVAAEAIVGATRMAHTVTIPSVPTAIKKR